MWSLYSTIEFATLPLESMFKNPQKKARNVGYMSGEHCHQIVALQR